jgi:hypothetical protein
LAWVNYSKFPFDIVKNKHLRFFYYCNNIGGRVVSGFAAFIDGPLQSKATWQLMTIGKD